MNCFPEKSSLLMVEDDVLLGSSLKDFLEGEGFQVTWVTRGTEALKTPLAAFDLLILDLILPDIPGEEVLSRIRQEAPHLLVLVLTAKGAIEDKQECFERGADDYLTKPFDPTELLLRVRALLRRKTPSPHKKLHLGEVVIDMERKSIHRGEEEIFLSRRGWDLLCYLIRHRGTIVTKEEILKEVWKDALVTEDSVRSYIKELRKILPDGAISTFKGRGYRLN